MHIPDGYLSPATSIIMFALVLPFWVIGVRKLREKMTAKNVPLIALFAAFSGYVIFRTAAVNTYLSRTVRIQDDRGQKVIDSGPYMPGCAIRCTWGLLY